MGPEAPLEICLHDNTSGKHKGAFDKFAIKDEFDVDVYKEIGAGHIIYMNKKKLINQISLISIDNTNVNVLECP